jgi:hypothetical protein
MCRLTLYGWRLGGRCFERAIARAGVGLTFMLDFVVRGGWIVCLYLKVYACVCAWPGRYIDLKIAVEGLGLELLELVWNWDYHYHL